MNKISSIISSVKQTTHIFSKMLFSISNFDNHLVFYLFGFHIRKKKKPVVPYINAEKLGINKDKRNTRIIASLTTFPERIQTVKETIKTLLSQTLKPDKVILWLSYEQFKDQLESIPDELLELQKYGLEIKWCNDIKSYKKLIPALKEFPEDIIITFDDDIYYPFDVIENLYKSYLEHPCCIHTNRGRRLDIKKNILVARKTVQMYWTRYKDCTYKNTITGCGGVLYPPHSLYKDVTDVEKFTSIFPTQDDIWFWAMAVLNHTKIKMVSSFDIELPTVENTQQYGLSKINKKGKNGISSKDGVNHIIKFYPEILDIIKKAENV